MLQTVMVDNTPSWSDDRVELLKKLWADGLSASQVATELGGITRNAVIGKICRLGLTGRGNPRSTSTPRPRKTGTSAVFRRKRSVVLGNNVAYEYDLEQAPEVVDNVIPLEQRKGLLELNEETCRWPVGDPATADFYFCGSKPIVGLPYCGCHSRIAYQSPVERRRLKEAAMIDKRSREYREMVGRS